MKKDPAKLLTSGRDEARRAADLVKLRNLDYEARQEAEEAEKRIKSRNKETEAKVSKNLADKHGTGWTDEDLDTLISMFKAGHPYVKIGKELGRTAATIGVKLCELRKLGRLPKKTHPVVPA